MNVTLKFKNLISFSHKREPGGISELELTMTFEQFDDLVKAIPEIQHDIRAHQMADAINENKKIGEAANGGLLSEMQAAEFLGFTIRTLQAWRYKGRGPKYVKISSRAVRYRLVDLKSWAEGQLISSDLDK